MTRFEPSLIVKRLVVKRNLAVAYDEAFHSGVNVVRGDNSSGKSTILNFIFFGLGGDLSKDDWSEHALLCDFIWLEVEFNGQPAVLRRQIDVSSQSPMEIFGGRFDDAVAAPIEEWVKYPYARSKNKESFSQAIFRLLEMPDVAVEGTSSITIHQILRLLYADQLSPIESIFRFEGYDPENLREAVGNLLCGAFDTEIYELQQLRRLRDKDFSEASAELRSIFKVVGGEESLGLGWVQQRRKALEDERERVIQDIAKAEEDFYEKRPNDQISMSAQKSVFREVQELQEKLQSVRASISGMEFEISDSEAFIITLHQRLDALRDADLASSLVDTIHFATCPSCYAEVLEEDASASSCHLCKTPLDEKRARERIVGLVNDLSIQIKQSERLQAIRQERLQSLEVQYREIEDAWRLKAKELSELQILPTSKTRDRIRELHRKLGYIDKSIEDTEQQQRLANRIGDLSARRAALDSEIKDLDARIEGLKRSQTERLRISRRLIESKTIRLLKGDLKRQDSFEDPQHVDFSFAKNTITVDEHTYFSASSRVVLKTSFLVGFLAAAMEDSKFRHPRFLMIDITEDKGMEQERSHNFQRQVIKLSDASEVEHQIILATAMPAPDIDKAIFVGKFSTRDSGTLAFA